MTKTADTPVSAGPVTLENMTEPVWTRVIKPQRGLLALPLREVWHYRDLLLLLVRRDFVALYKQTVLGPAWFVFQPVLMTVMFTLVFGNIAKISTDGIPHVAFYMAGITIWTYFADTFTKTSETFIVNANIFGKVYFPRVIMPLSVVVSGLLKFAVQFGMLLCVLAYFMVTTDKVAPNWAALLLPVLLLMMGILGFSLGMIISAMTTKYRDLRFLMTFGVQLLMYATPVIYPVSVVPEAYRHWILANPITPIVETFRYALLGKGEFDLVHLAYSGGVILALLIFALVTFNQVEKNFMDTV